MADVIAIIMLADVMADVMPLICDRWKATIVDVVIN